jgi:hypothetical protein
MEQRRAEQHNSKQIYQTSTTQRLEWSRDRRSVGEPYQTSRADQSRVIRIDKKQHGNAREGGVPFEVKIPSKRHVEIPEDG